MKGCHLSLRQIFAEVRRRTNGYASWKAMMNLLRLGIIAIVYLTGVATAQSNEGTEFAVVCTPAGHSEPCELVLSARQTTEVTITTASSSETVTVYSNWTHSITVDASMRPSTEIEDKGIYLSSGEPIAVHIAVGRINDHHSPDTALARPYSEFSTEYFLASYGDMVSTSNAPTAFYVIVATEDDTEVDVLYAETEDALPDEHLTLNRYEVFTIDCYLLPDRPEIDFTGTRIVSSKPVSVFGGNGQAYVYADEAHTGSRHLMDSMPAPNELGIDYITFPMHFGSDGGYEVRIIAVADDTAVAVPAFSTYLTLDAGKFLAIDNADTDLGFKISCSRPCMVAQYIRSLPDGGPTGLFMSAFMATLVPEQRVTDRLIFAVPSVFETDTSGMDAALSIIVNTYPVTDLFLNDTRLDSLDWGTVFNSSSCFATMEISAGFYQLYSTVPLQRFTAYMYLLRTGSSNPYPGFGAAIGYGGFAGQFPPEAEAPPIPLYRFVLLGDFTSLDGSDFSPECTTALQQSFYDKAVSMVPVFNAMVGDVHCTYVDPGTVRIISVTVTMITEGDSGVLDTVYLVESQPDVTISNLTSCTGELSIYMQDFENWGRPVVPPVEDCPRPSFEPDYFYEVPDTREWICPSLDLESKPYNEVEAPYYSISVFDNFTTVDGADLDAACSQSYQQEWQVVVNDMVETLNNEITAGNLCPGLEDKFAVINSASTFTSSGSQGSMTGKFIHQLFYNHIKFEDVQPCAYEVFSFLFLHPNWGPLPLLPQQPGCPGLILAPFFYHYEDAWECL